MVTVVVFEFSVMRCQPLRRALCACWIKKQLLLKLL
ncbi:acetyltransferase [Vibrio cholerae]|nr:acetyltransferase [Vibrio cholerae]